MLAVSENTRLGGPGGSALEKAVADLERVRELKGRIRSMQRTTLDSRAIATLPAFESLLPGGALHAGGTYSVVGSMALLMGLLAAPSAAGAWCGVVGVPEFGAEAAARFGIDLGRLVLVPSPGEAWLQVTAALADALTIVVARPLSGVAGADAARLSSRLRQRGAALISFGEWPGAEARLSVVQSSWSGIGQGHGYPRERRVGVVSALRDGRMRRVRLRLPGAGTPIAGAANSVTGTVSGGIGAADLRGAGLAWEAV